MGSQTSLALRLGFLFLCTTSLSGCLTSRVWEGGWKTLVHDETTADLTIEAGQDPEDATTLLVQAERRDDQPMPVASGVASKRSRWRLEAREGADAALALLQKPDWFLVQEVHCELERERDARGASEVYRSEARLHLEVRLAAARVAVPVDGAQLPLATLQALQKVPRNDFSGSGPRPLLPGMLAESVARLVARDVSTLVVNDGLPGPAELVAYAWVDEAGHVVADAERAVAVLGADFVAGELACSDGLQRLGRLRLLVAVVLADQRAMFLLRPDAVWLWGTMEPVAGGALVHESRWQAAPEPSAAPMPPPTVAGSMRVRLFDFRYEVAQNTATKVLLTPFALAADVLTLGLVAVVVGWCEDEGGEPCLAHVRR